MAENKRLNYFTGQFLVEADFKDEQAYHLGMRRLHNRTLHSAGVTAGLEVSKSGDKAVSISAGTALDSQGREILLQSDATFDLTEFDFKDTDVYVTIAYDEEQTDPSSSGGVENPTRTTEGPKFGARKTPPPEDGPAIALAKIKIDNNGDITGSVDNSVRRLASSVIAQGSDLGDQVVGALTLKRDGVAANRWPKLSCGAANRVDISGSINAADILKNGSPLTVSQWADVTGGIGYSGGNVGIGTTTPSGKLHVANVEWDSAPVVISGEGGGSRVGPSLDLDATGAGGHHYSNIATGSGAGAPAGSWTVWDNTVSAYRFVLDGNGNVGIGTTVPAGKLDVSGAIRAGGSDLYFTEPNHVHTGIGNAAGFAAIENSAGPYHTLMIIGRTVSTSPLRRSVSVWDELTVNGPVVTRQAHTIKLGVPSPAGRYGNDGIRGEPNLFLDASGTVFIKPGFQTPAGFDIAERFKASGRIKPGDVVIFDDKKDAVKLCYKEGDSRVVGIASTEPAFILGGEREQIPIALCGRVSCKVDADIAPIGVGDLLTTSPTKGHAQKVLDSSKAVGAILGKALGSLKKGKGRITVLVMLE
jgi:hypothetical protein